MSPSKLETHLELSQRQGLIGVWTDRKISAGIELSCSESPAGIN